MQFTLVSTVFNEAKRVEQTIADLTAQTLQPTEIIITDAGSTDGTYERLLAWKAASPVPITVIHKPKSNVAVGRNTAIRSAKYKIIASTDFGCRFHHDWLKSILTPFNDPKVAIVGGNFTVKEEEQQTYAAKAAYILSNGYTSDVKARWFIPSSRSIAYKKDVFNKVGGYCEWLTLAADDLVFGKEVLANGYSFYPVEKAYVYWIRHTTARGYFKEAGRYGLGDGEARINTRNFLSNSISLVFRYCFFVLIAVIFFLALFHMNSIPLFISLFVFLPGFRCYFSYTKNWINFKSSKYNLRVYLYGYYLLEVTRLYYIKGYIKGFVYSHPWQKQQARLLRKRLTYVKLK